MFSWVLVWTIPRAHQSTALLCPCPLMISCMLILRLHVNHLHNSMIIEEKNFKIGLNVDNYKIGKFKKVKTGRNILSLSTATQISHKVQKFSLKNTDPILHKFGSKDVLSYLLFSNNLDMQKARETLIWISHGSISQSDRQEQACKISQVRCTLQFQQRNLMMLLVQLRELGLTDWSHFRSHNAEIL